MDKQVRVVSRRRERQAEASAQVIEFEQERVTLRVGSFDVTLPGDLLVSLGKRMEVQREYAA